MFFSDGEFRQNGYRKGGSLVKAVNDHLFVFATFSFQFG